jgi:tRNA(Ile)-lysidine synthetase-like protein
VGQGFEVGRGFDANGVWDETLSVSPDCTDFPLTLRGWEPGDRIQLPYGTKKLKKLFSEAKIPVGERARIPVLADGEGRVLWVPGLASSVSSLPADEPGSFFIGIRHADTN